MAPILHPNPEAVMSIRTLLPTITTFSLPFSRGGLIKFGGRATCIRLNSGRLAIFSPVSLTPTVKSTIASLDAPVAYLIAPDLEHHIHLSDWAREYPGSKIIAPEGLLEKRKGQGKHEPIEYVVTRTNQSTVLPEEMAKEFRLEYFPMHPNRELAFFHTPTKSLIVADLLFNLPAREQYSKCGEDGGSGVLTRLVCSFLGLGGMGQARWNWWLAGAKDRKGFGEGVREVGGWGAERIVMCHGDVIEGRGECEGAWDKCFRWFLDGSVKK